MESYKFKLFYHALFWTLVFSGQPWAAASDGVEPVFGDEMTLAAQKGFESIWSPPGMPDKEILRRGYKISAGETKKAMAAIEPPAGGRWTVEDMRRVGEALAVLWIKGGDVMERLREFYEGHDRAGEWFPGPNSLFAADPGASPPDELSKAIEGLSGPYCDELNFNKAPKINGQLKFDYLSDKVALALFTNGLLCLDLPERLYEIEKGREWRRERDAWKTSKTKRPPSGTATLHIKILAVNDAGDDLFAKIVVNDEGWSSVYRARLEKKNNWRLVGLWNMTIF